MAKLDHIIRYAIYTRQSVERLGDFSSGGAQFHTCREFVKAFNDPTPHWCGQRFDDEGQSGAALDRPGVRKLREVIDLGGVDRVYAVAPDRLTRSMRDAIVLIDALENAGVDVRFVHQPELTFGAQGRFLRHVLVAFAEFERDMIATRIAESRAYLKQHGWRIAGKVPHQLDSRRPTTQKQRVRRDHFPFRQKIVCPHCKGVHYPAREFEQGVCEIFDDPATWRDLLGKDATDETVRRVMQTWIIGVDPWPTTSHLRG